MSESTNVVCSRGRFAFGASTNIKCWWGVVAVCCCRGGSFVFGLWSSKKVLGGGPPKEFLVWGTKKVVAL